jgi:hypothetical protein
MKKNTVNIVKHALGCVHTPMSFQDLDSEHSTFSFLAIGKYEAGKKLWT